MVACGSGGDRDTAPQSDGTGSGDGSDGSGLGELPFAFDVDTPIDRTLHVKELAAAQIVRLCDDVATAMAAAPTDLYEYQCLASSVEYGFVGTAPEDTCEKFNGICRMTGPGVVEDGRCEVDLGDRFREECTNPTVGDFLACMADNLRREGEVVALGKLSCAEGIAMGTIRPKGFLSCACGTPVRSGPPPEDDLDWDYVPNDLDVCPDTDHGYLVSAVGCAYFEDYDGDAVSNVSDRCDATEAGAVVFPSGCSAAQDMDADGVPNVIDRCQSSPPDAVVSAAGCALGEDDDQDGTPNSVDWCPATPEGAPNAGNGCSDVQGEPWKEDIITVKPDGLTAVTLGSFQENPVTFHVLPAGVTATAEGHDYEGPLLMEVPGRGFHKIEGAKVSFLGGTDLASPLDISGEVTLPLPRFGLFEALHLNAPGACKLGFGPGSSETLQALEVLIRPDRHYLYATCSVSFEMAIGTTWFDSPSGKDYTVVIDPFDPSVYLHGDVDGLPGFGPLREVGVGLSSQGLFPYAPLTSWGVESHVSSFEGHVELDGVLEVWAKLPFELFSLDIEGAAVVDLDPNDDGTPATLGKPEMRLGANGKLTAELRFFKAISLGLDLAEASLMATLSGDTREVAISGMAGPTELRLPEKLPLIPKGALKVAAFVTDEFGSSYVVAEGVFTFRGSDFNLPFIPDLLDVDLNVRLEIDADGARLTGTLDTAIHPWLEFTGGLEFEAELAWDGSHFHVVVKGDMDFDLPTGLTSAIEIYFGSDDIRINGSSIPFL